MLLRRIVTRSLALAAFGLIALILASCGGGDSGPDLIYYNGVVLTMDAANSEATAIAIDGDVVLAVGGDEVRDLAGSGTEEIDLGGLTLMPGIIDPHTHFLIQEQLSAEEGQALALENGITAHGSLFVDQRMLRDIRRFEARGNLRVRTSLYLSRHTPCGEDIGEWYTSFPPVTDPSLMFRIIGVKHFADGGACQNVAVTQQGGPVGNLWFTQEEMNQAVAEAQARGYQVAIHAMGDRAVEQAQIAIESALDGAPNDLRHRIDHNNIIRPDLLPRYAEIGVVPVIWSYSRACAPFYIGEIVVLENTSWLIPFRSLLDTGVQHVAWQGDYDGTPQNPFLHLFGLVTGKAVSLGGARWAVDDADVELGTVCVPPDWAKEETITVEQALPMFTINAAYVLGQESVIGSLEPGKFADVVVTSDNPLTIDQDAIKDIQVLLTMVGGTVEYCATPSAGICPE